MGTAAEVVVIFWVLVGVGAGINNCTDSEVTPTVVNLPTSFPGDFFGVSTLPDCSATTRTLLICSVNEVVITDGRVGHTSDSIDPTEFMAWNDGSRIILQRPGPQGGVDTVRQVNIYFYHEPAAGIGLPDITISASNDVIPPYGPSLSYTILGNQDLTADDAQVRNVTLALTEQITDFVSRFHINFSLTDNIQQFAVSEIQLCSNEATLVEENLTLELDSRPLTGPAILLPADKGQVNSSTLHLTCTVTNQGHYQWQWRPAPHSPMVSDGTRTSTIEIPLGEDSVGEYSCTASYHTDTGLDPSPVTGTFTVQLEKLLTAEENEVYAGDISTNDQVTLSCTLAGYLNGDDIEADLIEWTFNGTQLINVANKYVISISESVCPPYGLCGLGILTIKDLSDNDLGQYICSFEDISQTITLSGVTPPPSPSAVPVTSMEPTQHLSSPQIPRALIVGLVIAGVISILMVITVVVCIVVVRWCRSKTVNKQPFYDYVAPPQPPQLPERMEVKENVSFGFGCLLTDTQSVISQPAAYEVPQVSELQDYIELTENASYGHLLADNPQSVSTPPLQPNVAYGAIQVSRPPGLEDAMNNSQSTCPTTTENGVRQQPV